MIAKFEKVCYNTFMPQRLREENKFLRLRKKASVVPVKYAILKLIKRRGYVL